MNEQLFSIDHVLKEGWRLTKENIGFLLGYQLIMYFLVFLLVSTQDKVISHFFVWLAVVFSKMGFVNASLAITSGAKPQWDELYKNWRMFFSWVIASVLFGLMFLIGLVLLVVPGCYVLAKYGLFQFVILDKRCGPLEALKQAGNYTEGVRWPLILLFIACLGLNVLGALLFGIGLLLTVPVTLLALATVFRKLQNKTA